MAKKKQQEETTSLKSILELIAIIVAIIVILVFFPHSVIWNITVLLLMLSLLITIHEFGHFITAKKFGVHVYEFAIGMGPKVIEFTRKNDPTKYTLRALPIGGYNQLAGEISEDDKDLKPDQFMCNKPKWQRIIILLAGVTMNFILAIILLFVMALIWGSPNQESKVVGIIPESGASEVGIVPGDKIVKLNGYNAKSLDSLQLANLLKNNNDYNTYVIKHEDGSVEEYKVELKTYVLNKNTGETVGIETEEYTLDKMLEENNISKDDVVKQKLAGVQFDTKLKRGFLRSLKYSFIKFGNTFTMMFRIIYYLIVGALSLDALSGPVGMYTVIDTATNVGSASYGLYNLVYLTAYISINLGVMNVLPFPAVDGGQLMFVLYEIIARKKGNTNVEAAINLIGFILLFALMILITCKDVFKLIG